MTKKKQGSTAGGHDESFGSKRSRWGLMALAMATVVLGVVITIRMLPANAAAGTATEARAPNAVVPAAVAAGVRDSVPPAVRLKLIGRWLRADGGYLLTIGDVAADGIVQAAYANPNPIRVSKAAATQAGERTSLYVELRDRGYPGNNYVLEFDSAKDQLIGRYHHLGINQDFEVFFQRLSKESGANH